MSCFLLIFLSLIVSLSPGEVRAQSLDSPPSAPESTQSPGGVDFSWREGVHLGYHYGDTVKLELGGRLLVDGGYIAADQALRDAYQSSYPPLQGWNDVLRSARVKLVGTFYQTIEAKVEVEFAQTREFKDVWIASKKRIPVLGYVKAG